MRVSERRDRRKGSYRKLKKKRRHPWGTVPKTNLGQQEPPACVRHFPIQPGQLKAKEGEKAKLTRKKPQKKINPPPRPKTQDKAREEKGRHGETQRLNRKKGEMRQPHWPTKPKSLGPVGKGRGTGPKKTGTQWAREGKKNVQRSQLEAPVMYQYRQVGNEDARPTARKRSSGNV